MSTLNRLIIKNREIRTRGWSKERRKMFYFTHNQLILLNDISRLDNCDFMQCIDLCDQNGKEVYESDILEFSDSSCNEKRVVIWEPGGFVLKRFFPEDWYIFGGFSSFYPSLSAVENTNECRIIGNIYENPEILGEYCFMETSKEE